MPSNVSFGRSSDAKELETSLRGWCRFAVRPRPSSGASAHLNHHHLNNHHHHHIHHHHHHHLSNHQLQLNNSQQLYVNRNTYLNQVRVQRVLGRAL